MLDILTRLTEGKAELSEIDELERLCVSVKDGSLCGLGKTSPNPVITGLRYFREEYDTEEAQIVSIIVFKTCN